MISKNWIIDGEEVIGTSGAAIQWEDERFFTIEYKGKVFNGEIMSEKTEDNLLEIKVNHRVFAVRKQGLLDELIASLGMDKPKVKKLSELKAPMPGRIVSLSVSVGQSLEIGDPILSLEAMKMENVLKAEGIGVVKAIFVSEQQVVDKGTIMIEFE